MPRNGDIQQEKQKPTQQGRGRFPNPWTSADLRARSTGPNNCFIALYDGDDSNSNGGVYRILPQWVRGHLGGPLVNACGSVQYRWLERNTNHNNWATNLEENTDIIRPPTANGLTGLVATYVGEFQSDNLAQDRFPNPWTSADLRARSTGPNNCFIALYDGDDSRSNGGVYQILPQWVRGHLGGPLVNACGSVQYRWLERNTNHNNWATNLVENTDIIRPPTSNGLTGLVATYVSEFQSDNLAQDQQGGARRSGSDQQCARVALSISLLVACSLTHITGR